MSRQRDNLMLDPHHKVTVRVLPGQVLRRDGFSATNGQRVRMERREAAYLENRGIVARVEE